MVVSINSFSEITQILSNQLGLGYDSVICRDGAIIENSLDLNFVKGMDEQLDFIEKTGGFEKSPYIVYNVRGILETMYSIKKGRIDIRDFFEQYKIAGGTMLAGAIDVSAALNQRRMVKELVMKLEALYGKKPVRFNAFEKGKAEAEIVHVMLRLGKCASGRVIANRLWDKYLADVPKVFGLLLSSYLKNINTLMPAERNADISKVNKRMLLRGKDRKQGRGF